MVAQFNARWKMTNDTSMIEPQLCKSFSELLPVRPNMDSAVFSPLLVPGPDRLSSSIIPVIALSKPASSNSISTMIFDFVLSLIFIYLPLFFIFLYPLFSLLVRF